jgi:hypothetical protein
MLVPEMYITTILFTGYIFYKINVAEAWLLYVFTPYRFTQKGSCIHCCSGTLEKHGTRHIVFLLPIGRML